MAKRAMYRMIWIGSLLAIIVMSVLFAAVPKAAPSASAKLVHFTTSDKLISLSYPENWQPHEETEHGIKTGVEFTPDETTRCVVKTDLASSLMADIAKSSTDLGSLSGMPGMQGMPSGANQKSSLEMAHEYQGQIIEDDVRRYADYKEKKAVKVKVAGTEALFTEFTFRREAGLQEVEMLGRRITAMTGDRRLSIVATCQKSQAGTLEPIFQKIIDSVQIGQGG